MKKLITLAAIAMLSAQVNAGDRCKGSVITTCPSQQGHITYITTGHPVVMGHPVAVAHPVVAAHPVAVAAPVAAEKDIVDTAVGAGSFKTLVAAVQAAGLVDTLKSAGPFTVFAPTDAAFAKLPAGTVESLLKPENKDKLIAILTYHVVPGKVMAADVVKLTGAKTVQGQQVDIKVADGKVMVDGATVVTTDIGTSNGVIHVIDSVILPADKDIVDTAVGAGSFNTLVAAVKAAGLVDTLKGKGPFTVFAPTDAAFAKLPAGTVESLLKPENKDKLVSILTYHVVAGNVLASDVVKLKAAKTVNGKEVKINVSDAGVMVDGAKVLTTDIETSNGVIHVIDSVILP
ncbi:MAG: fasciclin domain-containing protein [Fuerstiella sp.]